VLFLVDDEVPYLLNAGNFWLKVDKSRIVATKNQEEASHFHIISNSKPPDSFYIEHRDSDGIFWYVCADSKHYDDVKLQKVCEHHKSLFEVFFGHTCQKAKLSDWSKKALLIRRHEGSYCGIIKYYLAVTATDDVRLTSCGKPSLNEMDTKFTINNAPL
jgi:hypothetical protein